MTYRNALKTLLAWLFVLYCFVVLAYPAYGQGVRYPSVPPGCAIVGITNSEDEGFPVARCADGTILYADMDGDGRNPATRGRWLDGSGYASHMEVN